MFKKECSAFLYFYPLTLFPIVLKGKFVFEGEVSVFCFSSYQAEQFYLSWFQILFQEGFSEPPILFND